MNINLGASKITRDEHIVSVKLESAELAYIGKATSNKVRQFFENFLHVISFTLYDPTPFYEARGKQAILNDNMEVMEKNLVDKKITKRDKTNRKIGKEVNVKAFMSFIKTKQIFPDDTLINYKERKDVVDHLQLIFKLQKDLDKDKDLDKGMLKGLITPEELENLTHDNPENVGLVKDLNKIRLLMKYENIDEKTPTEITPATTLGLLKIALNGKKLVDINKNEVESFDKILKNCRELPDNIRQEFDKLLLTPQGSQLIKSLLSLYAAVPEKDKVPLLTYVLSVKNFDGIANARALTEQIQNNPLFRDILKNIDQKVSSHPDFGRHLARLSASMKFFSDLKVGQNDIGERFSVWMRNQPPQSITIQALEGAPEQFIQDVLNNLRTNGGDALVKHYQDKIRQNKWEDFESTLKDIFTLDEGLPKTANLFREIGFEKNIHALLAEEVKRGEAPEAILAKLMETAQEVNGRIERYSKLKLADGTSVADAFKNYLRNTDLIKNPFSSEVEKKFNLDQWNGIKDSIISEEVKKNVEESIEEGKYHYTETDTFVSYREFADIIAELRKPASLLGRIQNAFGFSEISNLIDQLILSQKNIESLNSVKTLLKPLNVLQKQYQRYGLAEQFHEQSNAFFSRGDIKNMSPYESVGKFLKEQESISSAFGALDGFQVHYFAQNDLKQIFDSQMTKAISLKLQQGDTLDKALRSLLIEAEEIGPALESLFTIKSFLPDEMKNSFETNFASALKKHLNKGYSFDNAVITINRNLQESERLDPQDLFRLKEKDFGKLFADKYLKYAQKGVWVNNKEKIYLDEEKFMQSTPEEQIAQIVPLLTQELNNQASVPLFREEFVRGYLGTVPENIDNRIHRLHHLAALAERYKVGGFAKPTAEQFEQFIRDFDNTGILTNILMSSDLQNKNITQLLAYYLKNNQDGKMTVLMEALGSSPAFVKALSGKNQERLNSNLNALIAISDYYLNFSSKGSYDARDIANGMRFLIEEKSGKSANLHPVAEALSDWKNVIMYSDMEKDLFEHTFKAFVIRLGSAGISTREGSNAFIRGLTDLFDEKRVIPDKPALEIAKKMIEKSRDLVMEGYSQTSVLNGLLSQKGKGTLPFNLKDMKMARLLDVTFAEIKKELEVPLLNNNAVYLAVQQNPFKAVTKLLPVFVEQILPEDKKYRAVELESRLKELENAAGKLPMVQNLGRKMAYTGALVNGLLPELHTDGGKVILETSKRVGERLKNKMKEVKNPDKLAKLKLKPRLAVKPDTAVEQMQVLAAEGAADGAVYLLDSIIRAQKIRLELKENNIPMDQVQLTVVESFLLETLPGLPYTKIRMGLSLAPHLLRAADFFNTFGEQMAKFAVKTYLRFSSNELSSQEQTLIAEGISPIVKILALAGPAVLQNHNVGSYLDFLKGVNDLVQSPELITKEQEKELHLKILAVMRQFVKELTPYENALDQAGKTMSEIK